MALQERLKDTGSFSLVGYVWRVAGGEEKEAAPRRLCLLPEAYSLLFLSSHSDSCQKDDACAEERYGRWFGNRDRS